MKLRRESESGRRKGKRAKGQKRGMIGLGR